jgi:hypothetical protein
MPYTILRGRWCYIERSCSSGDKIDDVKDGLYEELERVFDKYSTFHTKIMLEDLIAKVGSEGLS